MADSPQSIYDIDCTDMYGSPLPLRQFAGKPLLIVNTASLCRFSSQFKGLEDIWRQNKDKGLVVLGVPTNDFGHQEPGNSAEIVSLCLNKFGATFPFLEKTAVSGRNAHPLFKWIGREGGFVAKPRWNFYKYIIGRDGHLKDWFFTFSNPERPRFHEALDKVI